MQGISFAVFLLLMCFACTPDTIEKDPNIYDWEEHIPFVTSYSLFFMPVTEQFQSFPEAIGEVSLSETSGLAYSRKNPGMLWAHNDSGHPNNLFLLDASTGQVIARYKIANTHNLDWEDIEVASGPVDGESYIYLADTGDNNQQRPSYVIYRFPEPEFQSSHTGLLIEVNNNMTEQLRFTYPDGSHDVEGIMVDPQTKDIFLVTKRDVLSTLYVAPYTQSNTTSFSLVKVGTFSFREASAATVSLDGEKVLIKNRQDIFYWERQEDESFAHMLSRTPVKAPYIGEPQGEAICFDPQDHYFTLSEELNQDMKPILYKYFINP